jgi:cytochrome P450
VQQLRSNARSASHGAESVGGLKRSGEVWVMSGSGPVQEVTLTGYEDVRRALGDEALSRSLDPDRYEVGNIKNRTLSILHGDEHRDRRRAENVLFRRQTLELYERVLFPEIVEYTLRTFVDPVGSDLMEIGGLMTVVLAARTAGVDFDHESLAQRQRLRHFLHLFALGGAIDVAKGDVEEIKGLMMATLADFEREFVQSSWIRREGLIERYERGEIPAGELPADALTTLLSARRRGELDMDDGLVLREVTGYFTAGAHTSTQTLANTFHQLFSWCSTRPDDWARLADDLYFVQRSVQEALRCRPTNPMIHRRALTPTTIGDHVIPAGAIVLLDTVAANTDPLTYGRDAAQFNPHRRLPRELPPWGTSFGGGMHLCIGRTLAVGLPARTEQIPGPDHLFGLVPLAAQALIRHGVQPDPSRPPTPDSQTERWTRWAHYPVRFEPAMARTAAAS